MNHELIFTQRSLPKTFIFFGKQIHDPKERDFLFPDLLGEFCRIFYMVDGPKKCI
jgi:hypothetical protein